MRNVIRAARSAVLFAVVALTSCSLDSSPPTDDSTPRAAVKVINLLQGVDNALIGFETGRPLTVIAYPSVAPTEPGTYFFVPAAVPKQLRVLLTTATVLDSTVTFADRQTYTIFTLGSRTATGVTGPGYLVLQNNMTVVANGGVRLRFVHGATATVPVDVHVIADSAAFTAAPALMQNVRYRGTATVEARLAGNRRLCVIATGVVPTATGSNCLAVLSVGVAPGISVTAALRDPVGTETTPGVLLTVDRTP